MKLICSTLPFRNLHLPATLQKMASLGAKCVELCIDPLHSEKNHWEETPERVRTLANQLGITVNSIHVPQIESPKKTSFNELQKISTEKTINSIDLAAFFRADYIVQHVALKDNSLILKDSAILEKTIPRLSQVIPYATVQGVKLAIENVPTTNERMLGANAKELIDFVNLLPTETVGVCLDITHCIANGFDPLGALDMIDFRRLISIHGSDNFSNQLIDQHLPIGTGDFPWKMLFGKIISQKFQGSFVVEVSGDAEGEKALTDSLSYLKKFNLTT